MTNVFEQKSPVVLKKLFLVLWIICEGAIAQTDQSFLKEVREITQRYDSIWDASRETIVFTGSSSIRLWGDLQERFPKHQIVNSGFGGSQAYDLLVHLNDLVLRYHPKKVFIYEGDNDINAKKRRKDILFVFENIVNKIQTENPSTEIVLISAKPSISRWRLRRKYRRLNRKLKKWADENEGIRYADVWTIMLNGRRLKEDLFIEDGLHMNAKGYELWYQNLKPFLD